MATEEIKTFAGGILHDLNFTTAMHVVWLRGELFLVVFSISSLCPKCCYGGSNNGVRRQTGYLHTCYHNQSSNLHNYNIMCMNM